jgi:hypothetical protein
VPEDVNVLLCPVLEKLLEVLCIGSGENQAPVRLLHACPVGRTDDTISSSSTADPLLPSRLPLLPLLRGALPAEDSSTFERLFGEAHMTLAAAPKQGRTIFSRTSGLHGTRHLVHRVSLHSNVGDILQCCE